MAKWNVGKQTITRIRRAYQEAGNTNGIGPDGRPLTASAELSETPLQILATVNPIPGKEILTLPEGERQHGQMRCLTEEDIRPVDDDEFELGDHIIYKNQRWEVRDTQVYDRVIPHHASRIRRVGRVSWSAGPDWYEDPYALSGVYNDIGSNYLYLAGYDVPDYDGLASQYNFWDIAIPVTAGTYDFVGNADYSEHPYMGLTVYGDGITFPILEGWIAIAGRLVVDALPASWPGAVTARVENVVFQRYESGAFIEEYQFLSQIDMAYTITDYT